MSVKDVAAKLQRKEAKTEPGAGVLTSKQMLLDSAADVKAKRAEDGKHVRWVNLSDPTKIQSRQNDGYQIIPTEEGGRRLGDQLVLMECPQELLEAREAKQEAMNKARLNQHKTEMERLAEQTAKILRDQHGIDVSPERLLVKE